jgi:hypothetical protein
MNEAPERDNLLHDLWRESCSAWVATARWAQVAMIAGFIILATVTLVPLPIPHDVHAWIRVLSYATLMAGVVEHVRSLDEFYMHVYVYSAAFAAVASSVILVAAYELDWPIASQGFAMISATFGVGFFYNFIRLRRP